MTLALGQVFVELAEVIASDFALPAVALWLPFFNHSFQCVINSGTAVLVSVTER